MNLAWQPTVKDYTVIFDGTSGAPMGRYIGVWAD